MTCDPGGGQGVDPRARRGGADDHDHRSLGDGGDDPALERQPGARVEDHPGGLAGRGHPARGQQGVVVDRCTDADRDRIEVGAPAMDQLPGLCSGDPPRLPRGGRGAAVEGERGLENDQRATGAGVLAECLVEPPGGGRVPALRPDDLDPTVAKDLRAAAARLRGRIVGSDHDPPDSRREDGLGAGRLAPLVRAGLERDVHGRARPGRRHGPGRPRSRQPRRGARRGGRESPRRGPRPRAPVTTAPTSGFGLTAPRPPAASSSARRIHGLEPESRFESGSLPSMAMLWSMRSSLSFRSDRLKTAAD